MPTFLPFGGGTGAEVIYALRNNSTLANKVLENIGSTGQTTRRVYQRVLPTDTSKDYYYMLRNTGNTESLIIEYGFLDNEKDKNFLNTNYEQLGDAVVKAILDYKNIPYEEESITNYVVVKGDSLYGIAKRYNTTVENLKKVNNLTSDILTIGDVLNIPTVEVGVDNLLYTVKKGDSLYSIAKEYDTTVDEIKDLNNLSTNLLSIGDTLKIPVNNVEETNTYLVKSGDSLYSIAKSNNTSVDKLKDLNNLTSNFLSVGQILVLPSEENYYTVSRGDTLYSIAKKFNTTVDILKTLNNLTNNLLSVGETIKVK